MSAYGDNGEGDDGDTWIVECDEDFWRRDETVRFRHQVTRKYLHVTGDSYGRPIQGQYEVSAYSHANSNNLWRVQEGVYIKPNEQTIEAIDHSEL